MEKSCVICFKALSVPARFEIFEYLKRFKKRATVSSLVQLTSLSQPTVTFHVNLLAACGLVEKHRLGREVCCSVYKKCANCPLFKK